MHVTSGRWRLGLSLAAVATLMWGVLPIVLKLLLHRLDAYTLTWFRFLAAALILGAYLWCAKKPPRIGALGRGQWLLLAVATLALAGNYLLFLLGLKHITPEAAEIMIQIAPMLLLVGGLTFFGERFSATQWLGLGLLLGGLALFFNHRLQEIFVDFGDYGLGIAFVIGSAISWATYAIAQKQLLSGIASTHIMLMIYLVCAFLFLPASRPALVQELDVAGFALLVFAALNTLIAYGSFAEAMDHWEASRVSAVIALAPLVTLMCAALIGTLGGELQPEPLNALSLIGALLTVAGSMLAALAGKREVPVTGRTV